MAQDTARKKSLHEDLSVSPPYQFPHITRPGAKLLRLPLVVGEVRAGNLFELGGFEKPSQHKKYHACASRQAGLCPVWVLLRRSSGSGTISFDAPLACATLRALWQRWSKQIVLN